MLANATFSRKLSVALMGLAIGVVSMTPGVVFAKSQGSVQDFFSSQTTSNLPVPPSNIGAPQPIQFQGQTGLPQLQLPQIPQGQSYVGGAPQNFSPVLPYNPAEMRSQDFPTFIRAEAPGGVFPDPRNQAYSTFPIQPGTAIQPQGYQQGQPYAGTGSNWQPPADWTWPQQAWGDFQNQFLPRVLERPRARQTWIVGDSQGGLNMNELELATTATIPNFMGSNQPLRISPGFIWHWLDGPDSTVNPGFDLPSRVYSAYLSFDHMTNPVYAWGFENNFRIGVYSDFNNSSSDSLRMTGKLVGWSRLNSYTVGKLGVEYFDRIDVKLLPAFGIYMAPNADIRWDLYFPRTKLAHRLPNLGDYEVWGYLGAEYGGDSWSIDRSNGVGDRVDINDVRSFLGFEWMGPKRVTGFMEFGYVFNREIVYHSMPGNNLELGDAFMWRSGVAF